MGKKELIEEAMGKEELIVEAVEKVWGQVGLETVGKQSGLVEAENHLMLAVETKPEQLGEWQ